MKKLPNGAFDRYSEGAGKELMPDFSGKTPAPPKMAAIASSSRMIYELKKKDNDFRFEEKLPTTVGGIAHLDGYKQAGNKYIFVEAKRKEFYSGSHPDIKIAYKPMYEYLNKHSEETALSIKIDEEKVKKRKNKDGKETKSIEMAVTFEADGKKIERLDVKQLICHLLGIATRFLSEKYVENTRIEFIYLIYNPTGLDFGNYKDEEKEIRSRYNQVCREFYSIDVEALFKRVVDFLLAQYKPKDEKSKEKEWKSEDKKQDIVNSFVCRLCDQDNFIV